MRRDLPSYEELLKIFSAEKLKPLRIITIALCLGIVFFFIVVMVLYSIKNENRSPELEPEMLNILLIILFITSFTVYSIVFLLGDKILSGIIKNAKISFAEIVKPDSRSLLGIITSFTIVRLAMFEGSALFGLVILLLSVINNHLDSNPVYWLGSIPGLLMLFYAAIIFPTGERVAQLVQDKIYPLIEE